MKSFLLDGLVNGQSASDRDIDDRSIGLYEAPYREGIKPNCICCRDIDGDPVSVSFTFRVDPVSSRLNIGLYFAR